MVRYRFLVPFIVLGIDGLGFFGLLMLTAPPLTAASTVWHVPGDFATIQAAISAAQPGDTVRVRGEGDAPQEVYHEHLHVSKAITLSGGWNNAFTAQNPGTSIVDGDSTGRVISITTAGPERVTIEGFVLTNGDATGVGGVGAGLTFDAYFDPGIVTPTTTIQRTPSGPVPAPADLHTALHMELAEWLAADQLPAAPGGVSGMTQRLAHWEALAAAYGAQGPAATAADVAPDCGGAVYSAHAALWLHDNVITNNMGSRTGKGSGGGVCVVDTQADLVRIEHNVIAQNVASAIGEGSGGGVYLASVDGAIVTGNDFQYNVGSPAGAFGLGGALFAANANRLQIDKNTFEGNAAATTPMVQQPAVGGAIYAIATNDFSVAENRFSGNLASLYGGGVGGAVYLYRLQGANILTNTVEGNWGVVYNFMVARAGGIGLGDVTDVNVVGNRITGNVGGFNPTTSDVFVTTAGGGVFAAMVSDALLAHNVISDNVGAMTLPDMEDARGGGVGVDTSRNGPSERWRVTDNVIMNNRVVAAGSAPGTGGGARLTIIDSQVAGNRIAGNRACSGCDDEAEHVDGLLIEGALESTVVSSGHADVEANFILGSDDHLGRSPGYGIAIGATDGFTLTNNVIAGFDRGLDIFGSYVVPESVQGTIVNNTFVAHKKGIGIGYWDYHHPVTLINNVVVSAAVGIDIGEHAKAVLNYTLLNGNGVDIEGAGSYTNVQPVAGAPAFVNAERNNFDLLPQSAAIEAGDPAGVPPAPPVDIIGTTRPQHGRVDIGAYEAFYSPPGVFLPAIFTPNACKGSTGIGWAVGDPKDGYGMILHTIDGGSTWQRQGTAGTIPDMPLEGVKAIDANNAWVVGAQAILRTRDGGQSWQTQPLPAGLPAGYELQDIGALDGNTGYIVGAPTIMLQTTNGLTWTQMPAAASFPVTAALQTVSPVDKTHIWAAGAVGARERPVMAFYNGTNWQEQNVGAFPATSDALIGVSALDDLHVWAVGGFSMPLIYTNDGGITWLRSPAALNTDDMNRVVVVNATTGWVTGDFGRVIYTTNSGATWQVAVLGGGYQFGVTAMNTKVAWMVGTIDQAHRFGLIARTCDAAYWESRADPSWPALASISFVGARR